MGLDQTKRDAMRDALDEAAGIIAGMADMEPEGELRSFLRERTAAYKRLAKFKATMRRLERSLSPKVQR